MISGMLLLMVVGLLVFGPKKTVEMAQTAGALFARLKQSATEVGADLQHQAATKTIAEPALAHAVAPETTTLEDAPYGSW